MAQKKIDEAVVVLTVRIRKPGIQRKVNSGDVRVRSRAVEDEVAQDPDESALKISKAILESPEYGEIRALDSGLRAYLRSQALPARLGGGQHLLPVDRVEAVDARVLKVAEERDALVEKFLAVYPQKVEEAKVRLGDLFDEEDYAPTNALREEFVIVTSIASLPVPGAGLANVSKALYARELRKVEAAREAMVAEIRDGLRVAMHELVGALVERLSPTDGSTPKVMASHVEKLQAFVRDFQSLNVSGDEELAKLVEGARALISTSPTKLRASASARETVVAGLRTVREALDGMISSNSSTLRGAALDLGDDSAPRGSIQSPESAERSSRLDLSENERNAVPAPITTSESRGAFLDLSESREKEPARVEVSLRTAALELE